MYERRGCGWAGGVGGKNTPPFVVARDVHCLAQEPLQADGEQLDTPQNANADLVLVKKLAGGRAKCHKGR